MKTQARAIHLLLKREGLETRFHFIIKAMVGGTHKMVPVRKPASRKSEEMSLL